ncbi:transmembrane protein [Ceratobasidium sp. AG-Ba]|nr:transmembrane protein [Ceratobasidium sp. AG-Ba]
MSTRRRPSLFFHINSSPNPNAYPTLWEHRLEQRRPLSRNPFEPEGTSSRGRYDLTTSKSFSTTPTHRPSPKYEDDGNMGHNLAEKENIPESTFSRTKNIDMEWGDQIPGWLNLFVDLAWSATFSSLTSNAKFKDSWGSVSYVAFFTTAWWLWVSQVFYNVEFYTDDWRVSLVPLGVHLPPAAPVRGTGCNYTRYSTLCELASTLTIPAVDFDITSYILRSPGSDSLETYDIETITPERYAAERLTKISVRVIMIAIAISRVMLLIQHLRVVIYAKITAKSQKYPLRLLMVPASLVVSATLFFAAFRVTMSAYGRTPAGAKVKLILWSVALLVEMVAHIVGFHSELDEVHGLKLRSHASINERLTSITIIILGEAGLFLFGINAIAGTFYAIQKAPGFSDPTATGIVCCAVIVFFLAYLYFNGAAPLKSTRRRVTSVMMHLPWLLSVILLLEGVKDQLLLQSFISSATYMATRINEAVVANVSLGQFNATIRPLMLQGGMFYNDEYASLMHMYETNMSATTMNITEEQHDSVTSEITGVWYLRMQMKGTLNTYITYMDNSSIPDTTQEKIQEYLSDYNYTLQDYHVMITNGTQPPLFFQTLSEMIEPNLNNARYIMATCSTTFITLASLNLIQSWPRDRFQWGSIISRYIMGIIAALILLLNLGQSQDYREYLATPESNRVVFLTWVAE